MDAGCEVTAVRGGGNGSPRHCSSQYGISPGGPGVCRRIIATDGLRPLIIEEWVVMIQATNLADYGHLLGRRTVCGHVVEILVVLRYLRPQNQRLIGCIHWHAGTKSENCPGECNFSHESASRQAHSTPWVMSAGISRLAAVVCLAAFGLLLLGLPVMRAAIPSQ